MEREPSCSSAEEPGVLYTKLGATAGIVTCCMRRAACRRRAIRRRRTLRMKGNEVFKVAVKTLETWSTRCSAQRLDKGEIDWLIPHQANIRIIQATAKRLQMPMERVVLTVPSTATRRPRGADGARHGDP
jgi:3-oxoacyl-[acyl-carrier-protein] synthase III